MKGAITTLICVALCFAFPTHAAAKPPAHLSQAQQLRLCDKLRAGSDHTRWTVRRACKIAVAWPVDGSDAEAATVAWCEGTFNPEASNGQYKGTFQMGAGARARWGHGSTVAAQAVAASRYYRYARRIGWSGGWGPWSCKPGSAANRDAWHRAPAVLRRYVARL